MENTPKNYYSTEWDNGPAVLAKLLKPVSDLSQKYGVNKIPLIGDLGISGTQSLLEDMGKGYSPVYTKEMKGLSQATGRPFNTLGADPRLLDLVSVLTLGAGIKPSASNLTNQAMPYANKLAVALQRPLRSPVTATEVTAPKFMQDTYRMRNTGELVNNPEAMNTQRQLFEQAGNKLSPQYTEGQGAWADNGVQEFNKAFVQKLPRQFGSMEKGTELLSNLAQTGTELNQVGMGASRFIPHIANDARGANAISVQLPSGMKGEEAVIDLYKKLGGDFAVQHRPHNNSVLVFDINNQIKGKDLGNIVQNARPESRITYGRTDNAVDRVYLTKDKWWDKPEDRPQGIFGYEDVLPK